jgi:hypothetical protein
VQRVFPIHREPSIVAKLSSSTRALQGRLRQSRQDSSLLSARGGIVNVPRHCPVGHQNRRDDSVFTAGLTFRNKSENEVAEDALDSERAGSASFSSTVSRPHSDFEFYTHLISSKPREPIYPKALRAGGGFSQQFKN